MINYGCIVYRSEIRNGTKGKQTLLETIMNCITKLYLSVKSEIKFKGMMLPKTQNTVLNQVISDKLQWSTVRRTWYECHVGQESQTQTVTETVKGGMFGLWRPHEIQPP